MSPETVRRIAYDMTRRVRDEMLRTVFHLPPSMHHWRPGGVARSAVEIVAHCAVLCRFYAAIFADEPIPYRTSEEMDQAIEGCGSLDEATEFLREATTKILTVIENLPDKRSSEVLTMPWGERLPFLYGLLVPAMHLQYHLGQICQLQTMQGDDEQY